MVTDADLQEARDKVLMGVERRSVVLSELDRVNCAYHEAGHAVVAALLPKADPLHKVTIIPRGRAMGVTMQLPEADRHTYTKDYLETQVAVLMGGRVAEELFMNHMTSGASNDIERATDIAQHMVCEWGMSELGPLAFRKPGNAFEADRAHAVSEATAQRVDEEIRKVVMDGYDHAKWIIEQNRRAVRHDGRGAARASRSTPTRSRRCSPRRGVAQRSHCLARRRRSARSSGRQRPREWLIVTIRKAVDLIGAASCSRSSRSRPHELKAILREGRRLAELRTCRSYELGLAAPELPSCLAPDIDTPR